MKLIAQVKLTPTPEQHVALLATLAEANAACDTISAAAWQAREFRRLPLQKLVYHNIKDSFRLGAQILVRCIAKVADAYKLDRKTQRTFQPHGAIAFDDRNLTWYTDKAAVSIWTLQGRQYIPYSAGEHQRALLTARKGESDLVYHRGAFYLLAVCDVPEPDEQTIDGVLGVDLGIVNLATDSDGERYSGRRVERKRRWYANLRARLQKRGSLSAKRHLRKLAGKQRQFQKNTNHRIAKQLVQKAGVPSGPHEAGDCAGRPDAYPHADDGTEIWTSATQQLGLRPVAAVYQLQGAACWRAGFACRSGLYQPAL
jgi:putative transposase